MGELHELNNAPNFEPVRDRRRRDTITIRRKPRPEDAKWHGSAPSPLETPKTWRPAGSAF